MNQYQQTVRIAQTNEGRTNSGRTNSGASQPRPSFVAIGGALINLAHIVEAKIAMGNREDSPILEVTMVTGRTVRLHGDIWGVLHTIEAHAVPRAVAPPQFALDSNRPAYVEARPYDIEAHREAQKAMFGAAREAGLDTTDRDKMLAAINYELGTRLESRRQMTPNEMEYLTVLFQLGYWAPGWVRRNPAHFTA